MEDNLIKSLSDILLIFSFIFIEMKILSILGDTSNILFFTLTKFTKIEKIDPQESEDHRIYIKFNFFGNLLKNNISTILIELPEKKFEELKINKEYLYYMYNINNSENKFYYFIQNINLVYNNGLSQKFQYFVYQGLLNEANIDITQIGVCAYEFLYFSLDQKFLPSFIELED